jgi:hypothetical protein
VDSFKGKIEDVEALLVVVSDRRGEDQSGGAMERPTVVAMGFLPLDTWRGEEEKGNR